jgi:hypothetical protein
VGENQVKRHHHPKREDQVKREDKVLVVRATINILAYPHPEKFASTVIEALGKIVLTRI